MCLSIRISADRATGGNGLDAGTTRRRRRRAVTSDALTADMINASAGCAASTLPGHWPTIVSGGVADIQNLPSQRRPFRLSLPTNYRSPGSAPPPLLLHFHGWGGSLTSGQSFHAHGVENGYLVASPLGFDDEGTQLTSWNGAGTAASPGPLGPTCYDPNRTFANMCYARSCVHGCTDTCWCARANGFLSLSPHTPCMLTLVPAARRWTTCEDSVQQVAELLDELERAVCFDPRRVFATGVSNGGVFLYELATSRLASKFAAFMPIVGLPHRGASSEPEPEA